VVLSMTFIRLLGYVFNDAMFCSVARHLSCRTHTQPGCRLVVGRSLRTRAGCFLSRESKQLASEAGVDGSFSLARILRDLSEGISLKGFCALQVNNILCQVSVFPKGHPVRKAIVKIVCFCFISFVQTFNSFAFVFVGLKGMGYCHAAKALVAQQAKDPITAFALNETLNDVTQIAKLVAFYVSLLCAVVLGWNLGIIGVFNRSFSEFFLAPLLCMFLGALTSYSLTLIMGRLLEASLCTIFVIYGNEDWRCSFKVAQPKLFHKIDDAYTAMSTSIIPDCDCWCSCCSCCCCSPGQEDADGVSP